MGGRGGPGGGGFNRGTHGFPVNSLHPCSVLTNCVVCRRWTESGRSSAWRPWRCAEGCAGTEGWSWGIQWAIEGQVM